MHLTGKEFLLSIPVITILFTRSEHAQVIEDFLLWQRKR